MFKILHLSTNDRRLLESIAHSLSRIADALETPATDTEVRIESIDPVEEFAEIDESEMS